MFLCKFTSSSILWCQQQNNFLLQNCSLQLQKMPSFNDDEGIFITILGLPLQREHSTAVLTAFSQMSALSWLLLFAATLALLCLISGGRWLWKGKVSKYLFADLFSCSIPNPGFHWTQWFLQQEIQNTFPRGTIENPVLTFSLWSHSLSFVAS